MSSIHIFQLAATNQIYADFPRQGWQDRLILFAEGTGVSEIGVGDLVRVYREGSEPNQGDLQIRILECPFMRYPAPDMKALHVEDCYQGQLAAIMQDGRACLERISDA